MEKIDLHIHSHCSDDGELSPEALLRLGKQAGINYMAITDHNTVRGVSAVLELAPQMGIEAISGVELDCVHQGQNFHLLGYDFLERMLETGIDGIEAYSSYHGRIEATMFDHIAQSHNLLVTCGSDFHGKIKPSIQLCGHRADENMPRIIAALKNRGILKTI